MPRTPLPADDTPADPESERLADLDQRLRGDGARPPAGAPGPRGGGDVAAPPLGIDDVDLLLRLNQAGADHRERVARTPLAAPVRFGRFEIVREAGRGGFATVYEAIDTFLDRRVALKVAHPGVLVSETLRVRFLREAELASRLRHPRLVTIHEFGEHDGLCYIVEEFCEGGSLAAWLEARPGPVEPRLAAEVVLAIAEGLQSAHAAGISHRDIKPENVLLAGCQGEEPVIPPAGGGAGWTVKLGDFGLGKAAEGNAGGTPLLQLTREGARLGTPAWMAPEQVDPAIGPVGPATDVHALGLLLDRLLAGRSRWSGASDSETLRMILLRDPYAPDGAIRGVPADLSAVVAKCLARRTADRYPSAVELASDLARFQLGLPTVARPLTPLERAGRFVARRPTLSAIGAATLLLAIVAGWGLSERTRQGAEIERRRDERERFAAALELRLASDALRTGNVTAVIGHLRAAAGIDVTLAASDAGGWIERRLHGEEALLLAPPAFAEVGADGAKARPDLHCLAVSPDGRLVAAGGADGRLHLVPLDAAGRPSSVPMVIPAHDEINDVACTPDGSLVATAGEDGRVRLFRADTGAPLREVVTGGEPLFAVALPPDGRRIAWAGAERVIRIQPLGAGDAAAQPLELRPFPVDPGAASDAEIEALLFLDDRLVVASCGSRVAVIDAADGTIRTEFVGHDSRAVVGHVALSADRRRLLSIGTDRVPRVWDVDTGRSLLALPRHPDWVQGADFTPDGRRVVTGCKDGVIRVFDVESGALVNRLAGHVGRTWDVRCDPAGNVLSAGADGTLRRWDPARPPEWAGTSSLPVSGETILAVVPCSAAAGGEGSGHSSVLLLRPNGPVEELDVTTGERRLHAALPAGMGARLSVDPIGRRYVIHGLDGTTTLFPLDGGPLRSIPGVPLAHASVWTASGRCVVTDFDSNLWVCDGALERSVRIDGFPGFIDALAVAPADRQRVAAGGGDLVRLHTIPSGRPPATGAGRTLVRMPPEFGKVYRLAWSHDGRRHAVGSGLGRVTVIDGASGRSLGTFSSHPREIVALAWSPDDRLLFTADLESVRVSDTMTTVMIDELRPGFDIQAVTFTDPATPADRPRLLIAGGASAWVSDEGEPSMARLLMVDFAR